MITFGRQRGYVTWSTLEKAFDEISDVLRDRLHGHDAEIRELRAEVRKLREDLDAERRYRLSMRK